MYPHVEPSPRRRVPWKRWALRSYYLLVTESLH